MTDSRYILKVEPTEFADRLNVGRKRKTTTKDDSRVLVWATRRELLFTRWDRLQEEWALEGKISSVLRGLLDIQMEISSRHFNIRL